MNNVLVLSAGRRVELVRALKKELKLACPTAATFAIDSCPELSAACHFADNFSKSPKVLDPGYQDYLFNYCMTNEIGLVIPTIDTELQVLAEAKSAFGRSGINLVVSERELVELCSDKTKSTKVFASMDLRTPNILNRNDLTFPCFVKPVSGSGSEGAYPLFEQDDVAKNLMANSGLVFMEYFSDQHEEYTIDVYFDRYSTLKCLVPRLRLETRGGEVSKGVTRKNHVYEKLLPCLKKLQGATGCITVQVFSNIKSKEIVGIEINPRIGGGFPLTHRAGANYLGWLLQEYLFGTQIDFFDAWTPDLMMLRYDAGVFIDG